MSWQIDLFRVPPGQDPYEVRDLQYGDTTATVAPAPSAETDQWIRLAVDLLDEVSPGFKLVEELGRQVVSFDRSGHVRHVRLWQPEGPLIVNLYPECADVRVNTSHPERYAGEWFDALWSACRILAERAECAVFPEGDDDPTDMTMDPEEARDVHRWA